MNTNKVLVLDSDFGAAESVASVCRAEGMSISRATDGRAALEMFLIERPDAIVVSALPRDPGDFNICAAVAKDANPIPIIVLVSPNEEEAFRRGRPRPSGATAFLVKPIRPVDLRALFQRVFVPPGIDEEDEELDGVLAVLNPMKPGSAKASSPAPAPVRVRVPPKNRPESVDSIVADILADIGIEKKQKNAAYPPSEAIGGSGDRKMRLKPIQADPPIHENREPKSTKPRLNLPILPAGDPSLAVPKDVEKATEFETLPPTIDNSFGGLYKETKRKPEIKSLAIAVGLTLAVTVLIYSGLRKKTPAPILPEGSPTVSGIEKKPFAPLPEPASKEAPGAETKPSAAAQKPTMPDQGARGDLQAGTTNPIPPKAGETSPPTDAAPTKADPAVSKSISLDQFPGFGLQSREISDIPTKPAETIPPPVTTPAKDGPPASPAVKMGQWVPLDQVDVQPQLTSSVKAVYPAPMMQRKIEGQLRFLVLISENGNVLKADLLPNPTDNPEFEAAARSALLKRKYTPALKDGVPVQVSMPINVVFKLNR